MTISPWTIYIWGKADDWMGSLSVICFITFILSAAAIVLSCALNPKDAPNEETLPLIRKLRNFFIVFFFFALVSYNILPNSKTIAIMTVLPAIVNSQPIQQDVPEVYRLGVDALKEKLGEIVSKENKK